MRQTVEKHLIVDIFLIQEIMERNERKEVTWIEKERQISDVFTKAGVSSSELLNVLSTSKMITL